MVTASAPGKVILFGEHAVVYDKLGIACTFDKRCRVRTSLTDEDHISIGCNSLKIHKSFDQEDLFLFLKEIRGFIKKDDFNSINKLSKDNFLAPSFFVVASILNKYGFQGLKIEIESEIPKNLGSSSAVFASLALSVTTALEKGLSKDQISNFAYLGDIIAHGGTPSGIDNNIVTYGGYLQYQKSKGIKILDIDFRIPLLIVDSGEDAQTGEMVSYLREKKKKFAQTVNFVLDNLDDLSKRALNELRNKKFIELGKLMNKYYWELSKLDLSTDKLDEIIEIALDNRALGAKPTGGWGGGCCLVLTKEEELKRMQEIFLKKGYNSLIGNIGVEGVKII